MFRLRPRLLLVTPVAVAAAVVITVSPAAPAAAAPLFIGDYATGDFSQWPTVQNKTYNASGKDYVPTYSATIVQDPAKGKVPRFDDRAGDVPTFGGGEPSQESGDTVAGGSDGQTRWYRFSTKFDPTFPQNHADLGWALTNQWPDGGGRSPRLSWEVDMKNGYWSLAITKPSQSYSIFDTPLNVGQWHDVMMQIHWSPSDTEGWIKLWHNGVQQTFVNGADTYFVGTLSASGRSVYYKEGMYRQPMAPTDIVYHTGFRSADSESGL
jgi:hypothetical protein